MPSPLHGRRSPFALPSDVVYFHDWRYVQSGVAGWRPIDEDAESDLFMRADPPAMRYDLGDMPRGVRLVAQKATRSEPVLEGDPREIILFGGSLIHEGGRYRFWYDCWPDDNFGTDRKGSFNILRYAESVDGVNWRMPDLGLVEHRGDVSGNVVFGGDLVDAGGRGYHGGCVFTDPSAPESERYKLFYLGRISPDELAAFRKRRPDAVDSLKLANKVVGAIFGATSPDGLRWTRIEEPLVVQTSDTHNCCTFDAATGKYVAYCRTRYFDRRSVGRTETDDFRRFPLPEPLFWPGPAMEPYDVWYAQAKTHMPGAPDWHVMFPMRWSHPRDRFDCPLATSPDGYAWGFVPGADGPLTPVIEPGEPGAWDAGVVEPGIGLVALPGERMGIPYSGSPVGHKHPRKAPLTKIAWATWPKERLVALEAPVEGRFALHAVVPRGRQVRLNLRTHASGFVAVEAVGPDGVVPGRSFADCDPISGDAFDRPVTWRGENDPGHPQGGPLVLRFRMQSAEIYAVRFA